jgi:hypothetical protein
VFDWNISVGNVLTFIGLMGAGYAFIEKKHAENRTVLLKLSETLIALVEKNNHLDECVDDLKELVKDLQKDNRGIWQYLATR